MDTLILLGNGFDKSLGYQTGYDNFYENCREQLNDASKKGNKLCEDILTNPRHILWSDLENGLYHYSLHLTEKYGIGNFDVANKFKKEFEELRTLLFNYLKKEISKPILSETQVQTTELYSLWYKLFDPLLVTFTYTISVLAHVNVNEPRIFYNNDDSINETRLVFQHGAIYNTKEAQIYTPEHIVLGIDDSQQVENIHSFLYKSNQHRHDVNYYTDAIKNCKNIIIFGCSAGESDRWYFEQIFNNQINSKTFLVYAYGIEGMLSIKNQIDKLTTGSLTDFERRNHVEYIDNSTEDVINSTKNISHVNY